MSTACDLLREAREQRHLSLADVADATLVNIEYLRAIEQGRLDMLPQPYVRAFMREFAAVVGLDPGALMEKLDREQAAAALPAGQASTGPQGGTPRGPQGGAKNAQAPTAQAPGPEETSPVGASPVGSRGKASAAPHAGAAQSVQAPAGEAGPAGAGSPEAAAPEGPGTLSQPHGLGPQTTATEAPANLPGPEGAAPRDLSRYTPLAAAIVIIAIAAVILWNILGRKEVVAPERPFHEVVRENERLAAPESTGLTPAGRPESKATASVGDSLTLIAQASDSVWVRMMRDDGLIRDYFFRPGESMTWFAREQFLFFTIGNPGAFSLKLNGQPLALPGSSGRPLQHLVVRSTGIVTPGSSTR